MCVVMPNVSPRHVLFTSIAVYKKCGVAIPRNTPTSMISGGRCQSCFTNASGYLNVAKYYHDDRDQPGCDDHDVNVGPVHRVSAPGIEFTGQQVGL